MTLKWDYIDVFEKIDSFSIIQHSFWFVWLRLHLTRHSSFVKLNLFIFHYVLDVLFKFWFQYMMLKWCKTWIFYYKVHNAFDFTKDVNQNQSKLQCGAWDDLIYFFFCLLFFERFWFLTLCFNFFCQLHESYNCSLFCLLEHGEMHGNTFLFWFWLNLKALETIFLSFFFCCNTILFCWSEKFGGNCFHFSWIPIMFLIFLFIPLKGLNFNLSLIP